MSKQVTTTVESSTQPESRRSFLRFATVAAGAVAGLLFAIPLIGFVLGAFRKPPLRWISLGPIDSFRMDQTQLVAFENSIGQPWDGLTAHLGADVRRIGTGDFIIFAMNCTHLGCPVTWFPQSGLFMCPCHGGVYYENGEHASGPPPRGLFHMPWRIRDGALEVRAPHLPTLQNTLEHGYERTV